MRLNRSIITFTDSAPIGQQLSSLSTLISYCKLMKCVLSVWVVSVCLLPVMAELMLPSERANQMLKNMTLEEKLQMMRGCFGDYVGNIQGNKRLGIPALAMQDGPQGFRVTKKTGKQGSSTAWPSSLNIAASFDPELAYRWAAAMADEFVAKGSNMNLSPGLGIARVPLAGRNFEYLCGEDPVLGALLGSAVVKGIQSKGIIANAKHFVNNEIETNRRTVSSTVNEKVRFQLYYPPFQAAIDAGVLSMMCSYNLINGKHACENDITLHELRNIMGFKGFLISDWLATHSTVTSVSAGLDQELPIGIYFSEIALQSALMIGELRISQINTSVLRILTSMYSIGLFDRVEDSFKGDPLADVTSKEHSALAREVAAKSIVLLKNSKKLLPLDKTKLKRIGVFGDEITVSGGGSGYVSPSHDHIVTATEGIKEALIGYNVTVEYFKIPQNINKEDSLRIAGVYAAQCDVIIIVVATNSGEGNDRISLELDPGYNDLILALYQSNPHTIVAVNTPGSVLLPWSDMISTILICWMPGEQAGNGLADILFNNINPSARLPITIPNIDNEIEFTKDQYPGVGSPPVATYSEELLIGYRWYDAHDIEPSFPFGHGLSYTTFEYKDIKIAVAEGEAEGVSMNNSAYVEMKKEKEVEDNEINKKGRSSDLNRISSKDREEAISGMIQLPLTRFHTGTFFTTESSVISRFDNLLSITVTITNNGSLSGREVVQLYITYPVSTGEPLRQLRGVRDVFLLSGESADVVFSLSSQDLAIWDVKTHSWILGCNVQSVSSTKKNSYHKEKKLLEEEEEEDNDCNFIFSVGASSRDLRLTGHLSIQI